MQIYPLGLPVASVGKNGEFTDFIWGVFFWYLLFSADNSWILKPYQQTSQAKFSIPKRMGLPVSEGFVDVDL